MPRLPQAQPAQLPQHNANGLMPLGAPLALNPEIVAGATEIIQQSSRTTPWAVRQPEPRQGAPRKVFRSRMHCKTCGFKKKDHHDTETETGNKWKCLKGHCAKCGMLKRHHVNGGQMGPSCKFPPSVRCPSDWCQTKPSSKFSLPPPLRISLATDTVSHSLILSDVKAKLR